MKNSRFRISEQLSTHYDNIYSLEKEEVEWLDIQAGNKIRNVIRLCSDYKHGTILDIGAGTGSILKGLSELKFGQKFYAIDISQKAVEIVRKRNIESLAECVLFDGYNIPYPSNKFDLAIISHVIEHAEYPRMLLYEAARVARLIYVEVPLEDTILLKQSFVLNAAGHINFYSPKTINLLLETCNLQVLKQEISNSSARSYRHMFGRRGLMIFLLKEAALRIAPPIARSFFQYNCALVCKSPSSDMKQE